MAQNAKPAAQNIEEPAAPKNTSKKKLMMGAIAALVLLVAAGAGWHFTKDKDTSAPVEEVKIIPPKIPIFVALEPFTVNLQREASDQYLQIGISMKIFEPELDAKIKLNLPEIRSKILQLLTTKTATELLSAAGKIQLVKEIIDISNPIVGIIEAPLPIALAAASNVSATTNVALPASVPGAAPALLLAASAPPEKKGIIDVLFTSFIIQ